MIAALIIGGAVLEALGIALVALDVREARRNLRQAVSRQDKLVQVGTAETTETALPITPIGGAPTPEPTLEDRVRSLERGLAELQRNLDELEQRQIRDHRAMLDRVADWIAEARRETWELRQELRPVIARASAGNLRSRSLGVGLFLAGLGIQTAGNLAAL